MKVFGGLGWRQVLLPVAMTWLDVASLSLWWLVVVGRAAPMVCW